MQSAKIKMTKRTDSFAGHSYLSGTFFTFHFALFILHSFRPFPTGKLGGQKNATKPRATGGVSTSHFQLARARLAWSKTRTLGKLEPLEGWRFVARRHARNVLEQGSVAWQAVRWDLLGIARPGVTIVDPYWWAEIHVDRFQP